jgi:hypothetical protein
LKDIPEVVPKRMEQVAVEQEAGGGVGWGSRGRQGQR